MKLKLFVAILALFVAVLSFPGKGAVLPPDALVEGLTIAEWSAEAWKRWASFTMDENPEFDWDGSRSNIRQAGPVFFLWNVWWDAQGNVNRAATRRFTVPTGKYLYIPLDPSGSSNLEDPNNLDPDLVDPWGANPWMLTPLSNRNAVLGLLELATNRNVNVNGVSIPNLQEHRQRGPIIGTSSPVEGGFWEFVGVRTSGRFDPVAFDGYILMVEPLPPGQHVVSWYSYYAPPFGFYVTVTNYITVITEPQAFIYGPSFTTNGQPRLKISGEVGRTYAVQASRNLRNWTSISTNTIIKNPFEIIDTQAAELKSRFYRAVLIP